jgi:signal peptidase I
MWWGLLKNSSKGECLLKPDEFKPALLKREDGKLSLSEPMLSDLLGAVLEKGVPFRFRANGFSMSPFIKDGDVVTVSPLFGAMPQIGDVVAFNPSETKKLVIHRVVRKKGDSCTLRGDNALEPDGVVPLANILGRVTRVDRNGKRIILGLGPERWFIAFLAPRRLLFPLMVPIWRMVRPLIRRQVK